MGVVQTLTASTLEKDAASALTGLEVLRLVQNGAAKKLTINALSNFIESDLALDLVGPVYDARDYADFDVTGASGNDSALLTVLDAVNSLGGGTIALPPGIIGLSDEFPWGDGTNTTVSTKHNKIHLKGAGKGTGYGAGQALGVTVLRYIGAGTDNAKGVLNLKGPMHSLRISDMEIDANDKLGYGVITNHVTDFTYHNVTVRNWRANHYLFTTRTAFPSGGPWGCSNGTLLDCYAYDPQSNSAGGFKFTSGVDTASSLVNNPDSANIDVIGGEYFYGGSTGSYGAHFHGADTNSMQDCKLLPDTGNDGGGKSIFFEQWTGSTAFPQQNAFKNVGMTQDVGGTSGTGGNTFIVLDTGDGAAVPSMANVYVMASGGRSYMGDSGYGFALDHNTYLGRVSADTLGLYTGGNLAAFADSSGNLASTRSGGHSSVYAQRTDAHGAGVVVGQFVGQGKDSAGNFETYALAYVTALDHTSTSEDGRWTWQVVTAGTLADELHLTGANLYPAADDGLALGIAGTAFADLFLASGGTVNVGGTQVVTTQGAAVADASGGATVDAEARTAINTLLARLRAHGLIAT